MMIRTTATTVLVAVHFLLVSGASQIRAADLDPELLGKWPAFGVQPVAIAVEGSRAYCVFPTLDVTREHGGGLGIFDVSRPESPTLVGIYRSADARDVFVLGSLAYLADGREGLVILDVGEPAQPRRLGGDLLDVRQNGGGGRRVFVAGEHAYVVTGGNNGLYVVDVSDPEHPHGLGFFEGVRDAQDVFVAGDLAHVTSRFDGLHIVDVSDPSAPFRVGGHSIDNCLDTSDVLVSGVRAYVKDHCGIHLIDTSDPASPRELGMLPEACATVFVSEDLVYCAGVGLGVFDVSDPAQPVQVGSLDAVVACCREEEDAGGPIVVSGGHVYVGGTRDSTGVAGLQIADVSDPARPRWVGAAATDASARDVAASGDHAYVIDRFGMLALDVSDPGSPEPVARQPLDEALDIALSGSHVFVAASRGGLAVFDVSEPGSPRLAGSYRTSGPVYRVVVAGERACVGVGVELEGFLVGSGVEILDLANPASPVRRGRLSTSNSNTMLIALALSEERLYLADNDTLEILDIRNPDAPARLGGWAGVGSNLLALDGDRIYVAAHGRMEALDVSDPARPRPLGEPLQFTGEVMKLHAAGGIVHALVSNSNSWFLGLEIHDMSDPERPELIGSYATPGVAEGLCVAGDRGYLAAGELLVLDLGRRANPQLLGTYRSGRPVNGVFVAGKHAYVAADDAGLQVLDVSDRASPRLVGQYSGEPFQAGTTESAVRTFVVGSLAYVAANQGGLAVIDVSDAASPRLVGSLPLPGLANHVLVEGAYAYVEDNSFGNGMWVIDVSQPESPRVIGSHPVDPSGLHTLSIAGGHAFLGTSFALEVLTLEDPARPRRVGIHEARAGFAGSAAADGLVVASNYFSGLEVIDVTVPGSPRRAGGYRPELGFLEEVAIAGKHAYATNRMTGLEVIDISDPQDPRRVGRNTSLSGREVWQVFVAEGAVFIAAGGEGLFILDAFRDDAEGAEAFRRGDSNGDGDTNLSDAVHTLDHLFRGGPEPDCLEAADIDDSGAINFADPIRLLHYLFRGGPEPEPPGSDPATCGRDPVGSPNLGCGSYPSC